MTEKRQRHPIGIENTPTNIEGGGGTNLTREGELATDSSDNELKVRLGGATRTVVTENQTQVLTNKTIDADNSTISNLEVDNLKAGVLNTSSTLSGASDTQVPSALAVKTYADAIASSVSNKVVGPASSTDEAIARFDSTTGKLIQNSTVTLSDAGVVTGMSINADTNTVTNIENADIKAGAAIDRSKLATGTNNAVVHNNASGVMSNSTDLTVSTNALVLANSKHLETQIFTDGTTTGSAASLTYSLGGLIQLTNSSLVSLANIAAGGDGQDLVLINRTGNSITILDSSAASGTAANRIFTGSNAPLVLVNNASIDLKYDNASSRWQVVGGSGSASLQYPLVNYISNFGAETDTTGFAVYADAAGVAPVDGTGGSPTVTLTRSATSPLRGTASFLYTKPASNVQGQGFSYDFTINAADQGKVLQGSVEYQIASGTFVDDAMSVWIYDVTNAVMIQPAPYLLKNSGLIEKFAVEFQTAINSTSYRLIIHQASTSSVAATIRFDTFNFGPQAKLYGSAVTDWVTFAANVSSVGVATNVGKWRRVGDSMELQMNITFNGAGSGGNLLLSLPSGFTIDTTKLAGSLGGGATVGAGSWFDSGTAEKPGAVQALSSTQVGLITDAGSTNALPGTSLASGDIVRIEALVPITGWGSSTVMSNDADTRVVSFSANTSANSASTLAPFIFTVKDHDTHGAYSTATGKFTAPVPGIYSFSFATYSTTTGNTYLYKNNTRVAQGSLYASDRVGTGSHTLYMSVGDTAELRPGTNITAGGNSSDNLFSGHLLQGPAQIMASESVSALYTGAPPTGTLNSSINLTTFGTKVKDSHNAYSGGNYVVPTSGVYSISAAYSLSGTLALNQNTAVYIYVNGVSKYYKLNRAGGALSIEQVLLTVNSIPLLAGDIVSIRSATDASGATYRASSEENFFSIVKTGNY